MSLNKLRDEIHNTAVNKGWWDKGIEGRNFGEALALVHSEISEALEDYRNGHAVGEWWLSKTGKPEGTPTELADVIIRVLDLCGAYGIDIDEVMDVKMRYNGTRSYRHGGKVA